MARPIMDPVSGRWRMTWRDEHGQRRHRRAPRGWTEKEAAEYMNRLNAEFMRVRDGLADPETLRLRQSEAAPACDALEEYAEHLRGRGDTAAHVDKVLARCRSLFAGAGVRRVSDLATSPILSALAAMPRSEGTAAGYTQAVKGFARWLWESGRTRVHRLALLPARSVVTKTKERRALTGAEAETLCAAVHGAEARGRMAGPMRALVYRLAIATGLRANEIRTLTSADLDLDSPTPTVTAEARHAKNRTRQTIAISRSLADALRPVSEGTGRGDPLFPLPARTADMFRADMAAAGLTIADADGRVADFHALRHTTGTRAVAAGNSLVEVQRLMRHADPKLTARTYVHLGLQAMGKVAESVDVRPAQVRAETA